MARVVEAVQIFKKVEDVTAAKDDPSPVYLMDELAEMARGSAESSEKIADRIAKRLHNKSPVVKCKALRLIRHLVNKGCAQFQRSMQRHANLVREHMHYRGEPDPYKGDAPNQRVRDAAKDASESLFSTVMAQPVNSLGSRIQGFGSSAVPPPSSSSNSNQNTSSGSSVIASGSRILGFGSSNSSSGNNYAGPTAPATTGNGGSALGAVSFSQKGVNRPLTVNHSHSDAGMGNDSGSGHGTGASGNSAGGYGATARYTAPSVTATAMLGSEAQLVDSICTPGGLRLAPDADDTRRFVEAAGNLDGLKVAELLRDKMDGSAPWQQQLRALYALEAVLLQGSTQACGEIAVMFQSDAGPIQAASRHTQAVVRERANCVLKLLLGNGAGDSNAPTPPKAAATAAAQTNTVDLLGGLDFLGGTGQGSYGDRQQQQQQPPVQRMAGSSPAGSADDIFRGLAIPGAPGTSQQQQQQQHVYVPSNGPRPGADPFALDFLQPVAPLAAQQGYAPSLTPHWQQQQPVAHQVYGTHAVGVPGVSAVQPQAAMPAGLAAMQPTNVRPPLDDMFADMNISCESSVGGTFAGPGTTLGGGMSSKVPGSGSMGGGFGLNGAPMGVSQVGIIGMQYGTAHGVGGMGATQQYQQLQQVLPQVLQSTGPTQATPGLGMGMYSAGSAASTATQGFRHPVGMGAIAAGGMMVGPGGQVLYVGAAGSPGGQPAPVRDSGVGSVSSMMHQPGWQQQHATLREQQMHGGGGATFDFVKEQFK